MPYRRTLYDIVNRLLDGELDDRLEKYRDGEGLSYRAIAARITEETGVHVAYTSVRRWLEEAA